MAEKDSKIPPPQTVANAAAAGEKLRQVREQRIKREGTATVANSKRVDTILASTKDVCSVCAEALPAKSQVEASLDGELDTLLSQIRGKAST